jgi:hypothetical protein
MGKLVFHRSFLLCVCLVVFVISSTDWSLSQDNSPGEPSNKISGNGCIERGVETGCLITTDARTHQVYNLFFDSKDKPDVGIAISFQGTVVKTPTICMQGKPVRVQKWLKLGRPCPAPR